MSPLVEIRDLSKSYGELAAVKQLNLSVEQGDLFGFIGPNGAGKTSTIRMLATLLRPTSGDAWVAGHSVRQDPRGVRRLIGYMPDFFGVYDDMKVWEYLDFFAACYKIPMSGRPRLIGDLLELVELDHRREDDVDKLSRGMKQRLSLARTLVHDPQVLILDEPASGLDPRARVEIRALLVELSRMGKTIFFSTQILSDVAEICTRIGILEAGQIVTTGSLEELRSHHPSQRRFEVILMERGEEAIQHLRTLKGVTEAQLTAGNHVPGRVHLEFRFAGDDRELSDVLASLHQQGLRVLRFHETSRDLEDVFLRVTKGLVT